MRKFLIKSYYYLYEIIARFFDPATMASVWQLGASGPMNPAMSLKERSKRSKNIIQLATIKVTLLKDHKLLICFQAQSLNLMFNNFQEKRVETR